MLKYRWRMQWWKLSFFLQKTDSPPTHGASVCRCQYKRRQSQGPILRHVTSSSNTNSNSHPGHCDCMNGYRVVSNGQVVNGLMTHRTGECDRSAKDTKGVTKQHIKVKCLPQIMSSSLSICGCVLLYSNITVPHFMLRLFLCLARFVYPHILLQIICYCILSWVKFAYLANLSNTSTSRTVEITWSRDHS